MASRITESPAVQARSGASRMVRWLLAVVGASLLARTTWYLCFERRTFVVRNLGSHPIHVTAAIPGHTSDATEVPAGGTRQVTLSGRPVSEGGATVVVSQPGTSADIELSCGYVDGPAT